MFNRILNKIGEAAKSPQASSKSPSQDFEDSADAATTAEGFLCPSCMLAFPSPESLQNHYEISHGQEVNGTDDNRSQFLCPACKMRFISDQELQSHFARHHSEKGQKSVDELSFLRKDLDDLQTSLKEERHYSEELKKELGRVQNTLQGAGEESSQAAFEIYRSQVRTLEESKTLAISEIVLLKQHLEESRNDKESLKEEKSRLEQKTAALAGDYATVQARLDEIRSENEMLKSKLAENQIDNERLHSEVNQRLGAEDAALLRQELVSVQKMMDSLTLQSEAEKNNIIVQCKKLEEENQKLQKDLKDLGDQRMSTVDKSELEIAVEEQSSLRNQLEAEKKEVLAIQDKYAALQVELNLKNTSLQDEISKTVKLLEVQQDLGQQIAHYGMEKEKISFQLSERERELETLKVEMNNSRQQSDSLNSKKEDLQQQLMLQHSQVVELQQLVDQKESRASSLEGEVSKLKDTLERMDAERIELCNQIEAGDGAKTAISQLQQENASLQEQIQQQIQSASSGSQKSQHQIESLTKQINELKGQLSIQASQQEGLQAQLKEVKSSLTEAVSRGNHYTEQLKAQGEKLLSSEATVSSLNSNLEKQSQKFRTVQSQLEQVKSELVQSQEEVKRVSERLKEEQTLNQKKKEETSSKIKSLLSDKEQLTSSLTASQASLIALELRNKETEAEWERKYTDLNTNMKQLDFQLQVSSEQREQEKERWDDTVKNLENKLDGLCQDLSTAKVALEEEQEKGECNMKSLSQVAMEKEALLNAKQELESRAGTLEGELKEERQMKEKSQQQLNTCQAQLIESQEHAGRINKALDDLQELKEEMAERIQQLESECAQLSQAKENLTTLKGKLEHQLEERCKKEQDLIAKKQALEQKNAKMHEEFSAEKLLAQKAVTDINIAKDLVTEERNKVQVELERCQEELKQARLLHESEVSDAKSALANSEKLLQDSKMEMSMCLSRCNDIESQLEEERSQHEAQVCVLQENQATLRQDLSQQQDRADDLQTRLSDISGQKLELEAKLENALDERRALLDRCLRSEEECDKLQNATAELHHKLDDTLAALHELGRENQTLQIENAKLLQRKWTEDSEVTHCTSCKKLFTVTLRKHHCRSCGSIFCNDCSSKSATLASYKKPVRVCENCFEEVNA